MLIALTSRGFPAPDARLERLAHRDDQFYVVRLTRWERDQLRLGDGLWGKFTLSPRADGTLDLVRVSAGEQPPGGEG